MNPLENLNDKEKEMAIRILSIMGKDSPPANEEMMYLINNASPMVEILKKAISKRLVSLGIDSDEATAMVTVLTQMGTIAGGISFFDFSVTEKLFEDINKEDW